MTLPAHIAARQALTATVIDQRELLIAELQRASWSIGNDAPLSYALAMARFAAQSQRLYPMTARALVVFENAVRPVLQDYLRTLPKDRVPRWDAPIAEVLIDHFELVDDPTVTKYTLSRYERMLKWLRRAFRFG